MEFPIADIMFRSPGAVGKLKWSLLIPFKDLCNMIVRILLDTELYVTVKEIACVVNIFINNRIELLSSN